MSRRPATGGKGPSPPTTSTTAPIAATITLTQSVKVGSLSLDQEEIVPLTSQSSSSTASSSPAITTTTTTSTAALETESSHSASHTVDPRSRIIQLWKESAFAAALTESTWEAERHRKDGFWASHSSGGGGGGGLSPPRSHGRNNNNNNSRRSNTSSHANNNNRSKTRRKVGRNVEDDPVTRVVLEDNTTTNDLVVEEPLSAASASLEDLFVPDTTGCLCCSALICPLLGAQRVGNMAVLHSVTEWVEEVEEDAETGECKVRRYTRPKLRMVVGPYWPMLVFVTYPLILIVSGWAYYIALWPGHKPWTVTLVWFALTFGLIVSLALTACRDPGILYRHAAPPPQFENNWRWSDQAHSYRPRNAYFDTDTGVVVEEFDHTCPWTGTAIGKNNMLSFQFFVCLVFICLIVDIFLITGAL